MLLVCVALLTSPLAQQYMGACYAPMLSEVLEISKV